MDFFQVSNKVYSAVIAFLGVTFNLNCTLYDNVTLNAAQKSTYGIDSINVEKWIIMSL